MSTLGRLMTRHALKEPTLIVHILDREPTRDTELVSMVEKAGGRVTKCDICDPTMTTTLRDATKGMHTVICTICSDDEKTMVDGQLCLMKVCKETGVERVVPCEFTINCDKLTRDEITTCPTLRMKMTVRERMMTMPTPPVMRIHTGMMMETMIDMMRRVGIDHCCCDTTVKHEMTCLDDIARLTIAVITKRDLTGDIVLIGDTCTTEDIIKTHNKVRGTKLMPKKTRTMEDMKRMCEERRKEGDMKMAEMCTLLTMMHDPRTRHEKTHNTMLPEVKTMTVEDVMRTCPEVTL